MDSEPARLTCDQGHCGHDGSPSVVGGSLRRKYIEILVLTKGLALHTLMENGGLCGSTACFNTSAPAKSDAMRGVGGR